MWGGIEGARADGFVYQFSGLQGRLRTIQLRDGRAFKIYSDSAYALS